MTERQEEAINMFSLLERPNDWQATVMYYVDLKYIHIYIINI